MLITRIWLWPLPVLSFHLEGFLVLGPHSLFLGSERPFYRYSHCLYRLLSGFLSLILLQSFT